MKQLLILAGMMLAGVLFGQPTNVKIDPKIQLGTYGAVTGSFLVANSVTGVYEPATLATVQASVNYWTESGGDVSRATGNVLIPGNAGYTGSYPTTAKLQIYNYQFGLSQFNNGNTVELAFLTYGLVPFTVDGYAGQSSFKVPIQGATNQLCYIQTTNNAVATNSSYWWQARNEVSRLVSSNVPNGLDIGTTGATLRFFASASNILGLTIAGSTVTIPGLNASGTVITDNLGNLSRANHFDYSGVLTANRTMTVGSNTFTIDASGAASSPATATVIKGRSSGITRWQDIQDGSGVVVYRPYIDVSASIVYFAALNSYDMRFSANNNLTFATSTDKNMVVNKDGWLGLHGSLTADPGTTPSTGAVWYRSDLNALKFRRGASSAQVASVDDDMIGSATSIVTTSTHTPGGSNFFWVYNATSNAQTITLGLSLLEGREYLLRCRNNGTNTVTFNSDTGAGCVFYEQDNNSATTTSIVTGSSGTGLKAPYKIYKVRRSGTVIFFM